MDSKTECDIDLDYMECEYHATGRKNDVEEVVAWENGGKKETWKAKEEMVT
jgi:hypothetical protein